MPSEQCPHPSRVSGLVRLDFARPDAPDGPTYSGAVSAAVCEKCGHIEMHAKLDRLLCDWLRKT